MFKEISPYEIEDNVFRLIDKDWMLITAGKRDMVNTMTASWGHMGIMWNLPVAICYIRPQRYTFNFANENEAYTLSFFEEKDREILKFCGSKSGRNIDKITKTGLIPLETETGNIYFQQARMVMECKKIYQDDMKLENFVRPEIAKKNYPGHDYHRFYFGEIIKVLIR
jgi:flavin reductase (DIM6/NTAB) family NADH-FMN oxidoreductase RutF